LFIGTVHFNNDAIILVNRGSSSIIYWSPGHGFERNSIKWKSRSDIAN